MFSDGANRTREDYYNLGLYFGYLFYWVFYDVGDFEYPDVEYEPAP